MILIVLLSLFTLVCFATGCTKAPDGDNINDPDIQVSLNIWQDSVDLGVYESTIVTYEYNGKNALQWSSSDNAVATVNDGKIIAKGVGCSIINLTDGKLSDTITVNVSEVDLARLSYTGISKREVYLNDVTNLKVGVQFDGEPVETPNFNYQSSDTSIVSVENGAVTAHALGDATITLSAVIGGVQTGCSVNFTVKSTGRVEVTDSLVELDAISGAGFVNSTIVGVKVYEKDVVQSAATVTFISSDENCFTVSSSGEIVAKKAGNAILTVEYVGVDGVTVSDMVNVVVSRVNVTLDQPTKQVFSLEKSLISDLIADVEGVVSANVIRDDISMPIVIEGDKLDFSEINVFGESQLVLCTDSINYILSIEVWTDKLSTFDELKVLGETSGGWYKIVSDINLTGETWAVDTSKIFTGVLDGDGNTLTGLKTDGAYGLFASVGGGATIKNIVFENVVLDGDQAGVFGGGLTNLNDLPITIENVTADVSLYGQTSGGLFGAASSGNTLVLNDIVLHVYSPNLSANNGAVIGSGGATVNKTNVKVLSRLNAFGASSSNIVVTNPTISSMELGEFSQFGYKEFEVGATANKTVIVYGKEYTLVENADATIKVYEDSVKGYANKHFEIIVKEENGEVLSYKSYELTPVYHIYKRNITDIRNITEGTYCLKEDVDMSDVVWEAYAKNDYNSYKFTGVFDGQGHVISNFSSVNSSFYCGSLFNNVTTGTIKNLIMYNAKLNGGSSALVSRAGVNNGAPAKFENIFVSAVGDGKDTQSVLVCVNENSYFKNVVTMATGLNSQASLIAGGVYSRNVSVENVYAIGVGVPVRFGTLASEGYKITKADGTTEAVLGTDYFTYATDLAFRKDYREEKITPNKFLTDAFEASGFMDNYVELNQKNFKDVVMSLKDGKGNSVATKTLLLTEDIDLDGVTWDYGSTDYKTHVFKGVFDGQGYTIKNFSTGTTAFAGGLFLNMLGSKVMNVIFKNATINGTNAIISGRGGASAATITSETLENVYVQITSASKGSGLVEASYGLIMNNVVVDMASVKGGYYFAGTYSFVLNFTNVYTIGNRTDANGQKTPSGGGSYITGSATNYQNVSDFGSALNTNGANDFIKNAYNSLYANNN